MTPSWKDLQRWKRGLGQAFSTPTDPPWEDGPTRPKWVSAVLVPFLPGKDGPRLLFLRRSDHLRHHAGQICFPGGMREPGDLGPLHTALRETKEETGITLAQVEPLGILAPEHAVVTGTVVIPVVGLVEGVDKVADLTISPDETQGAWIADIRDFSDTPVTKTVMIDGVPHEYPEYPLENGWLIWGVTARILRRVLKRLKGPVI